ncbi:MAG TPA: hypothetical protein VGE93_04110 [Bryobacteraceae bacterium]
MKNAAYHAVTTGSQELECLGTSRTRLPIKFSLQHLASSEQPYLDGLLCQVEAVRCFTGAHLLQFPEHENATVFLGQAIHCFFQKGNRFASESLLLGIWIGGWHHYRVLMF